MTKKRKILVVDDEIDLVELIKLHLELADFEVCVAHNGKEAIQVILKEKPDLVLLDIMMPIMDGYQVCEQLRQDPLTKNLLVVMMTAMSKTTDRERGMKSGANECLLKPFDMDDLVKKLAAFF